MRNVRRRKTGTITKFFPISPRACEIIESLLNKDGDFIFSEAGEAMESNYRIIAKVCSALGIRCDKYTESGFTLHDLRRNFGTEIIKNTDMEIARELLGHSKSRIQAYI